MIRSIADRVRAVNKRVKTPTVKRLTSSYLSLFLAFIVLTTSTVSWFTLHDTATINSDAFSLESSTGLRVNEGEDITNHIKIDNFKLSEASSVDGRNIFFPTTDSFVSNTDEMVFREGNIGDKNDKYIYKDFKISADSDYTYVYIKSYNITLSGTYNGESYEEKFNGSTEINYDSNKKPISQVMHEECPIRIAFVSDSAKDPYVIDPTSLVEQHTKIYNAVSFINESGFAYTAESTARPFSSFYYGTGEPVFILKGTETLNATMIVWFEGTGGNCDRYANATVSVSVELESNWSDMEFVTFIDDTLPDEIDNNNPTNNTKWINPDNSCIVMMSYKDSDDVEKTVIMSPYNNSTTEWFAPIPKNVVENISFYRYSLTDESIYNSWHTEKGVNEQLSTTAEGWVSEMGALQESRIVDGQRQLEYTARRGNGYGKVETTDSDLMKKRLSPCIGYWAYGSHDTENPTTPTVDQDTTVPVVSENVTFTVSIGKLKQWVIDNIERGYTLNVELDDGSMFPMQSKSANNDYFEGSVTTSKGRVIKFFTIKTDYDVQRIPLSSPQVILSNSNMSFEMQNNDTASRTS